MHELGLCTSIVDAVERHAGDRPVRQVRIRVGRLHHVHPEAFDQSFAMAALGTIAEGADADLVLLPVRAACGACGNEWEGDDFPVTCPVCGGTSMELTGGDELVLESIEYRA
ncbi:MAG: hydrogenase maturation nickel metallochaperone HypA [Acidimicrobiaceae bacterium]|nr:hydrogenase maturation nickel metallochaperone HypA [Acidimicrobiaceae bacterium]